MRGLRKEEVLVVVLRLVGLVARESDVLSEFRFGGCRFLAEHLVGFPNYFGYYSMMWRVEVDFFRLLFYAEFTVFIY